MIWCIGTACGGLTVCSVQLPGDSPSSSNHNCLTVARIREALFLPFPYYLQFPEEPGYHRNIDWSQTQLSQSDIKAALWEHTNLLLLIDRPSVASHSIAFLSARNRSESKLAESVMLLTSILLADSPVDSRFVL
jgi:hypothetical protein